MSAGNGDEVDVEDSAILDRIRSRYDDLLELHDNQRKIITKLQKANTELSDEIIRLKEEIKQLRVVTDSNR